MWRVPCSKSPTPMPLPLQFPATYPMHRLLNAALSVSCAGLHVHDGPGCDVECQKPRPKTIQAPGSSLPH